MPTARPITALEIIAYANRLADTMLPAVVPPVFRVKGDASGALLPPFTLRDGLLHDAVQITAPELEAHCEADEVTLLDEPRDARPDHELWVGLDRKVHYEPVREASSKLRQIALDQVKCATDALRSQSQ